MITPEKRDRRFVLSTIVRDRAVINAELKRALQFSSAVPPGLKQAIRYAVLSPGKRLRPILCLESFFACGGGNKRWIIPFCCGIEFLHTFSLIHDDLPGMDNDDMRRGRPTLHKCFNEATAILAADALLALGYDMFISSPAPLRRRIEAISLISRAIGVAGMVAGQFFDVNRGKTEQNYLKIASLKTGELIAASIGTGAIIAGAPRVLQSKLRRLGLMLGVLFQLTDDLLDLKQDGAKNKEFMERDIISLDEQALLISKRLEKSFANLGPEFSFFAGIIRLILERKK